MNYITNERGESVPSVGADGSYARMCITYPDTIKKIIASIEAKYNYSDTRQLIKECNVHSYDEDNLLRAAMFYFSHKLEPLT